MALMIIYVDGGGFDVMSYDYLLEVTILKGVLYQNVAAPFGLKINTSQDHGQTASSMTNSPSSRYESPRSRSGLPSLPSSRNGSSNNWIGSFNSKSGSRSYIRESPSSRGESQSSRGGSPNCRITSSSYRCRSPSFTSGSPNYRSGSSSSRNGSSNSRSRSPSPFSEWQHSWSTSPSSKSGSPSSRSRSPSSRSGSPNCKIRSSSYRSGPESSSSRSPSSRSESPPTENTDRSGLVLPPAGIAEDHSGNEADIALGQNCRLERKLIADINCSIRELLPCHTNDVYDKEVETWKWVLSSSRENNDKLNRKTVIDKPDIDDPCMKIVFDEDSSKINIGELLSKSIIEDSFLKSAVEDVARKSYIDELCRESGISDSCAKISTDEVYWKTSVEEVSMNNAVDEVLHPTANEIMVSDFQSKSLFSQSDKYATVADKSTFILSDTCSQPEPKHSFGVISEQMQNKCHLATDWYEDCDKDHESSQIGHVECLAESLDDCKKGKDGDCVDDCTKKEVGDAAEQTSGNISIHIDDNASLKDGTGCKQDTQNLLIRLKSNDKVPERLSETISHLSHRLSVFGYSFNYVLRKAFPKNENHADTEDNDLPCKRKGLCDVSDSQFEENVPGCTEIYCSKRMSKAVARRTAEEMSYKHCICPHQRCSHRRKCMCSHEAVSRLSSAEVGDQDFEHSLGILMRFDPVRHMPWRHYIQIYNQPSSVTSSLYDFMNFEIFRLSSFDFTNFPEDDSSVVTNLAKSGFYFESPKVQIICFGCGNKYERSQDSSASSADSFHHPQCTRHVSNKPLDQFVQGLNLDALTEYFIQNGSLTPYLRPKILPSVADSSEKCTPKNVPKAGPISDLQLPTSDYSSEHESGGFQHVESEREADRDSQLSVNYSNTANSQEQSESDTSHLILTSATKWPVWFGSSNSRYAEVRANAAAEEGAVGGIPILNLDSASYPQFSIETVRRKSFTDWNPRHSHKPDDLAAAGFFYAGYSDCVRCFYCGLGLKFWRPEDIPAYQHARYRPHCQFNRLYKGQEYIDQVLQEQRSEHGATDIVETQTAPTDMVEVRTAPTHPQDSVQAISTSQVTSGAQELDYLNSEAARQALRDGWSKDQVRQAVSHIASVYGESCLEPELLTDILIHFSTQEEPSENLLRNDSVGGNDSGISTAVSQLTSSCPSSGTLANTLTVADDRRDRQVAAQRMQDAATPAGTSDGVQPQARVPSRQDILMSVEREHTLLEERVTCRLCRSKTVGCIYLPCGHVIACQECADNATHCVFCNKAIIGTANIFLA